MWIRIAMKLWLIDRPAEVSKYGEIEEWGVTMEDWIEIFFFGPVNTALSRVLCLLDWSWFLELDCPWR